MSETKIESQLTKVALVEQYINIRREASTMDIQAGIDLADFNSLHSTELDVMVHEAKKDIPNWDKLSLERRLELVHDVAVKLDGGDPTEKSFIVQSF